MVPDALSIFAAKPRSDTMSHRCFSASASLSSRICASLGIEMWL